MSALRQRVARCALVAAAILPWVAPGVAVAVTVDRGAPPNDSTVFVSDTADEANDLLITRGGGVVTVTERGSATMSTDPASGCEVAGPAATCGDDGVTTLFVSLGDEPDQLAVTTATNTTVTGGAGNDAIELGGGNDIVRGEDGDDTILGGGGDDLLYGDNASELDPGSGADRIDGGGGNDTIGGGRGNDTLAGAGGEDYVDGQRGVDRLDGGPSADVVAARDGKPDEPVSCGSGKDLAIVDARDPVMRRGANRCEQVDREGREDPRPGWVYVHPHRCSASAGGVQLGLPAMHRLVPLRYAILLASGFRRRRAPTVNAADCPFRLTATPGRGPDASAEVSGAAATIRQTSGRKVTTMLSVERPGCAGGARSAGVAADVARRAPHRLRVRTHHRPGRWKVRGRYSIAASYGTDWSTVEGCLGTTTIVRRGRVKVYDRVKRRTVTVRAGHRYAARR